MRSRVPYAGSRGPSSPTTIPAARSCASKEQSPQTRERAAAAGLEDAKTLASLVAASGVIFSVCPPHSALDLARVVAAHGFSGIYVDANAVSPRTAGGSCRTIEHGGATFVD